jgi:fructose-bisphosphate aldolase, class I
MHSGITGKMIRSSRFRYPGNKTGLIVPIDHGLTIGPVKGLRNTNEIATWIQNPAICAIVAHKGMVERLVAQDALQGKGVILHLNGMGSFAPTPNRKELLTSLETALSLGVDGVSVQINFDGESDAHNLVLLGKVVDGARRYSLPVLTMLYDKVNGSGDELGRLKRLRHLIRTTIELGTDSIKLSPPRSTQELHAVLEDAKEDVDIYFAGGELSPDEELLDLAAQAVQNGAAGLCVGRNVFQRNDPSLILSRLRSVLVSHSQRQISIPARSVALGGLANALTS